MIKSIRHSPKTHSPVKAAQVTRVCIVWIYNIWHCDTRVTSHVAKEPHRKLTRKLKSPAHTWQCRCAVMNIPHLDALMHTHSLTHTHTLARSEYKWDVFEHTRHATSPPLLSFKLLSDETMYLTVYVISETIVLISSYLASCSVNARRGTRRTFDSIPQSISGARITSGIRKRISQRYTLFASHRFASRNHFSVCSVYTRLVLMHTLVFTFSRLSNSRIYEYIRHIYPLTHPPVSISSNTMVNNNVSNGQIPFTAFTTDIRMRKLTCYVLNDEPS